ncbi:hypothetical protein ACPXCG_02210 [Gordonia sp. DT218]|uniref:hypothetical protein n=1 Tax=unclassified Gordonia (in: high G+C Gram-positive bacteria) TaxID=2657482 RepID=UPI003CF0279C
MNETHRPASTGDELRQAAVHAGVTIAFGLLALLVAWASDDGVRTALIVAAPIIVLVGALAALWRTYRNWRAGGKWQTWQGASWLLLAVFIVFLFNTAPALMS